MAMVERRSILFSLHAHAINSIEQQQAHEGDGQHGHVGIDVPQIGHDDVAVVGQFRDLWKHLLIGETEDGSASQETKQPRDEIVKFSFAGPGGTGAWSVSY